MTKPKNTDEYIAGFPEEVQEILQQIREAVKAAVPQAEEIISYGMPAFKWNGMLLWFGAHSKHIGFYPRVSAIKAFKKELAIYKQAKGSVQFALSEPMPLKLIARIAKFRKAENLERVKAKKG